jgi:ABC-type oligopeptide transport system substrate-binding subunit
VVPQRIVDKFGEDWSEPENIVSCGTFLLKSSNEDSMVFVRNPAFYGRFIGNVERVDIRYISSLDEGLQLYSEDRIDFLRLGPAHMLEHDQIMRFHAADYQTGSRIMTDYLNFNVSIPPFNDPSVRRAFVLATNRRRLTGISRGMPVTGGFVPPGMLGHVPDIALTYQPQMARRLLAEAGYPEGKNFPVLNVVLMSTGVSYIPDYVLKPWEEILGVRIVWKEIAWKDYFDYIRCEQPHISNLAWMADIPDPDNFLRVALSATGWHHEAYLAFIEEARRSFEHEQRLEWFRKAEEILVQEAPILPLIYVNYHVLVKPWIRNLQLNPSFRQTWHQTIIKTH